MDVRHGQVAQVGEVDVLEAFGGDVLPLGELEDVLAAIDDLESPPGVHGGDVARAEPPVGPDRFGRFLGVLVVPREEGGAADEEFAAGLGLVGGVVVHVGHVEEADFQGGCDSAAVADGEIAFELAEAVGVGFGEAVALHEAVAEGGAEEFVEGGVKGGGAGDHVRGSVEAEGGGDFAAPDAVVEGVGVGCGGGVGWFHGRELGVDDVTGESAFEAGLLNGGGADGAAEAVVETGDGGEECGA